MRIDRVRLWSAGSGEVLSLPLRWTGTPEPYTLKEASGLDSGDIQPISYGKGASGVKYYAMSPEARVVALKVEVVGDSATYSVQDVRDMLYRAISYGRDPSLRLDLMLGATVVASGNAFLNRVEVDYFTATPTVTITLTFDDPFFYGPVAEVASPSAFNTGNIDVNMADGNAPTGFQMSANITTPLTSFGVRDSASTPEWAFNLTYAFLVGDEFHLNSESGSLQVYVRRFNPTSGLYDNIQLGDRIDVGSMWPVLFPGSNHFKIMATTGLYACTGFSYRPKYWGV